MRAACAVGERPAIVSHAKRGEPDGRERVGGGPRAEATCVWGPGSDTAPVLARLREVARARV